MVQYLYIYQPAVIDDSGYRNILMLILHINLTKVFFSLTIMSDCLKVQQPCGSYE